jgi:integral membrane protein
MKSAVLRFRVMAIISGVMSLLLWFVYMPIKYLFDVPDLHSKIIWIPMVHGYLYPIYILTAISFSLKARWPLMKMLGLMLAGTLPIASLIAERRVVRRYS